jgi:hypothetical protein
MTEPYTGGCACGAVRYETTADPLVMLDCQCRQCQRESGTGHASHLTFPREASRVEGGATHWESVGDGGTVKRRAFCPTCGSPVYMTFPAMPDYFVVRAASLDDPSRYAPQMTVWTAAGQAWDPVDATLPSFEKMPPR